MGDKGFLNLGMTDEEKLRNAGWSPNSLRMAMGIESPPPENHREEVKQEAERSDICERLALKRSPNIHFGTPKSSSYRGTKMADQKKTPINRSTTYNIGTTIHIGSPKSSRMLLVDQKKTSISRTAACNIDLSSSVHLNSPPPTKTAVFDQKNTPISKTSAYTIDLSISTVKKDIRRPMDFIAFGADKNCSGDDSDDFDDVNILSQNFSRQSIQSECVRNIMKDSKKTSRNAVDFLHRRNAQDENTDPVTNRKLKDSANEITNRGKQQFVPMVFKIAPSPSPLVIRRNYNTVISLDCSAEQNFKNLFDEDSEIDFNSGNRDKTVDCIKSLNCGVPNHQEMKKTEKSPTNQKSVLPLPTVNNLKPVGMKIEKDGKDEMKKTDMEKMISAADLQSTLPNGWKLFQHQKTAVLDCLRLGRSIMAFDMGLGKTLISLIWAKAVCSVYIECVTVVIVPCTLIQAWKREAEMLGFDTSEVTTNYRCKNNSKNNLKMRPKISVHSWAKIPTVSEIGTKYVLIADEAHAMQSITSIRTKNILSICLHNNCYGLILSTGTPMKNGRPANIYPLLVGIRHPVSLNRIEFEKKYCNAKKTAFCAWDISGASNLEELRSVIGPSLLRKTKEECLNLPPLIRNIIKIDISSEVQAEYDNIIVTMKKKLKMIHINSGGRGGEGGRGGGADSYGGNSSSLEMMAQLRIFTSKSKVSGTAALIREKLSCCPSPIVVFVWFKETAGLLHAALTEKPDTRNRDFECLDISNSSDEDSEEYNGKEYSLKGSSSSSSSSSSSFSSSSISSFKKIRCETFSGDILRHERRQEIVDSFQRGEIDVLICTFGVGSTGLTLTKSHTVILLDRPWTPGDSAQAEDRVRRIGQLSDKVESIWIEAFDLDKKLDMMLQKKANISQKVIASAAEMNKIINDKKNEKMAGKTARKLPGNLCKDKAIGGKSLNSYFNSPKSDENEEHSEDCIEEEEEEIVDKNALYFGTDEEEKEKNNEKTQKSIMSSLFKSLFK